jgi:hypothetical protein
MFFNKGTHIALCEDSQVIADVPKETYNCSKIAQIQNLSDNEQLGITVGE